MKNPWCVTWNRLEEEVTVFDDNEEGNKFDPNEEGSESKSDPEMQTQPKRIFP